jgi:hypothetical protein
MALHHIDALDQNPMAPRQNFYDAAALAFIFARDYPDPIVLPDIYLYVHMLEQLRNRFLIK